MTASEGAAAARGGPVLVLLPGLHGTAELFAALRTALPAGAAVRAVEYPVDVPLSQEELCGRVAAELADAGPHVVVAESYSGAVAVRYAARAPSGLRGLALCATFVRNPLPRRGRWLRALVRTPLLRLAPPRWVVRTWLTGRDAPEELVEAVCAAIRRVPAVVLLRRLRDALDGDVTAEFARVGARVPVLYIAGAEDRIVGRRGLAQVASAIPGVGSEVLDAPHLVLQRRPVEAARAIVAFAEAVTRAAPSAPGA